MSHVAKLLAPLLVAGLFAGCLLEEDPVTEDLVEDRSVYDEDLAEVLTLELTVDDLEGLADVDANVEGAKVVAQLREGDFTEMATLKVRGATSRLALQKSFKVKLADDTHLWRGQRELNLNKHPYDLTRVRQQLSFTMFQTVDNFASLRTQLFHLYINGEDRGLYDHIEEPDDRYLESHGLDPAGSLYKAKFFFFAPMEPAVAENPLLLDEILEAKANPDSAKLLRMIGAVNDWARDVNDIVAEHFHRDNYLTWLATNMLLGNFDTRTQNFLLYSPSETDAWYFLPWDYDGALDWNGQLGNPSRPRWLSGLSTYWGISLHERFLRDPQNVDDLRAMMDHLRATSFADVEVAGLLDERRDLIKPITLSPPDLWNVPTYPIGRTPEEKAAQWDTEYDRMYGVVDHLEAEFAEVYARPMPVWLLHMVFPAEIMFLWTPSYDLEGFGVTYDFQLSTTPGFDAGTIVQELAGLTELTVTLPMQAAGTYYWRVVVRSVDQPEQNWQVPLYDSALLELL